MKLQFIKLFAALLVGLGIAGGAMAQSENSRFNFRYYNAYSYPAGIEILNDLSVREMCEHIAAGPESRKSYDGYQSVDYRYKEVRFDRNTQNRLIGIMCYFYVDSLNSSGNVTYTTETTLGAEIIN